MPAIVYKIDQLFPDLKEDVMDENVLLQTIRVPKKLLSLTNRLPKPNYDIDEKHNRHTTIGSYLPDIGSRKRSQYKPYLENKQNLKKLFGERSRASKVNSISSKVQDKTPPKNSNEVENNQSKNPQDDLCIEGKDKPSEEYNLDENKSKEVSPTKKYITNKKNNDGINQDILQLIRNKYIRRAQKVKVVDQAINKSDLYDYSGASIANSYIRQIVNRRNPIVKPVNYNVQMLANIYSDNPQQLSLVARKLQSIKRPKLLLKQGDYSYSPLQRDLKGSLRPKQVEAYKSKEPISKSRLEPIKLLNCKDSKDLQAIGIKPQALLPNVLNKN